MEVNPYLELRAQKIARNNKRLSELGLIKPILETRVAGYGRARQMKICSDSNNASNEVKERRTSPRLCNIRKPQDSSQNIKEEKPQVQPNVIPGIARKTILEKSVKKINPPPRSDSTRCTRIDLNLLISSYLGKHIDSNGKLAVIQRVSGKHLSFNKYSGICEWINSLFLWVNFGAPDADVHNEFLEDGRKITWFGGSNMHVNSQSIQRLLMMSQDYKEEMSGVILWVRYYDKRTRSFSPYVCLGRVTYVSHDTESHPISFILALRDYEGIIKEQGNHFWNK